MSTTDRGVTRSVFTTARFSDPRLLDGSRSHDPIHHMHAKTMGSLSTLCGLPATSWFKFWDRAFFTVTSNRCPACSLAFETRLAAEPRH